MQVRISDGYQHGKSYRVALAAAYQYADKAYQSDERVPKIKLEWNGQHGPLTQVYTVPLGPDGVPTLRPAHGLSRALMAHGVSWDDVKAGLAFTPIKDRDRAAYDTWDKFPPFSAHKTEGFQAIAVDVEIGGRSLIGAPVIALVEVDADGLARPDTITPVPEAAGE